MKIKNGLGFGGVLAIVALIGCGSGGGATGGSGGTGTTSGSGGSTGSGATSGGAFTTSVPSGTKLTSITSAQAMQFCNDYDAFANAHTATFCKTLAISFASALVGSATDSDIQAACTATYNDCLSPDGGGMASCDPTGLLSTPATCTATVGDATTCLNAEFTVENQLPSCSTVTGAMLAAAAADGGVLSAEPAVCTPIDACDTSDASVGAAGAVIAHMRPRR